MAPSAFPPTPTFHVQVPLALRYRLQMVCLLQRLPNKHLLRINQISSRHSFINKYYDLGSSYVTSLSLSFLSYKMKKTYRIV